MSRRTALAVLVAISGAPFTACGGHVPSDDDATRFERGRDVARDYTRAIRIYEVRCDRGNGDRVACRKLALARIAERGVLRDPRIDVAALLKRACDHGDWLACEPPFAPVDPAKAASACEAGQPAACMAVTRMHINEQSGTIEDEDRRLTERACHGGVLEACLVRELSARRGAAAPSPEATERATRACTSGDADACEAIGQPIAPEQLCRADDFLACAAAGKRGDAVALERACDHGIADACEQLAIASRDADPPDPRVTSRFSRACAVGAPACTQNQPADLAIGCAAYQPTRVPTARRIQIPPLRGTDPHGASWSAPTNQPYIVLAPGGDAGPARYAELARRLGGASAVYVLVDLGTDPGPFAPAIPFVLDPELADVVVAGTPSGQPIPGDSLGMRLRYGWPTIVDASGTPRAVLGLGSGMLPATLARCVVGLLAEP